MRKSSFFICLVLALAASVAAHAERAHNPHPLDGANDVPKNVILHWRSGTDANWHDVYFGSTEAEVNSATTGSGEYKTQLSLGTKLYDAGGNHTLEVGEDYFWRIDEVNLITVKGHIWDFTVANYILIDDFDFYANHNAQRLVWRDWFTGAGGNGMVWVNKDANFAVDGNSMLLEYWNNTNPKYSETMRTYSSGQDWSYAGAGVTELEIDWFGDVNSAPDPPMYVKLSDGSTTVQVNPGPNNVTEESQHTWHIPLSDFNDGGVTLSSITAITLGIGDSMGEGGPPAEQGTLYFDDIRLYPPRCYPEEGPAADFSDDCRVDVNDLMVVIRDWCMSGGWYLATMPVATPVVEYLFDEGSGTDVVNTGSYGSSYDLVIGRGVNAGHDWITDPNNDPCWFNDSDPCRGWTLWFDGNVGHPQSNYVGDTGDYLIGPALNLNSNTVTITAWLKPDPWLFKESYYWQKDAYTGLVHTRDESSASGLTYGSVICTTYESLGYVWNGEPGTWAFDSDLWVPNWQWFMAAVVIEPDKATLYLADTNGTADPNDDVMLSATNVYNHQADEWDGLFVIAGDGGIVNGDWPDRFFRGQMDAVRVYDVSLIPGEIMGLAGMEWEGMVYLPLRSDADLCVGNKSPTDPNAPIDDQIDLCDWSKFADEWLETKLWPQP